METLRGGILFLLRILICYPIVLGTYRVRNWTRSPFMLKQELLEKPGILVSNHANYVYDTMLACISAPVVPFVFVRDRVCRLLALGRIYQFFRAVPFIRSDDPFYTSEQRQTLNGIAFNKVATLLRKKHWLAVFPEGSSADRSRLGKLRPGVAHVALMAEDAAGWGLGLHIYVYGANYENKSIMRSNLFIRWAAAIEVAKYREAYAQNPGAAANQLMQEIEEALHASVLEAPTGEQLEDAHRLAWQHKQTTLVGVQKALQEIVSGSAQWEDLKKIVCRKQESIVYQAIGFVLLGIGWIIGWPFRMFGKLCASEPSQEMTYQLLMWIMVLITGIIVSEGNWIKVQLVATLLAQWIWLWAWRRGVIR